MNSSFMQVTIVVTVYITSVNGFYVECLLQYTEGIAENVAVLCTVKMVVIMSEIWCVQLIKW